MESLLCWPTEDGAALTRADFVRWWEARRLRFNLYVGAIGVVSWLLAMFAGSAAVNQGVDFEEPLAMMFGPFVYAFMANVCYTLGWVVDTVAVRGAPRIRFYKAGVVFSMVLTAWPAFGPWSHG